MKITRVIWLRNIIDKLLWKHNVTTDEVEEIFGQAPRYRYIETGDVEAEIFSRHGANGKRALSDRVLCSQAHGPSADYQCPRHDKAGKKSVCEKVRESAIQYQNISRVWMMPPRSGTAMIWLIIGTRPAKQALRLTYSGEFFLPRWNQNWRRNWLSAPIKKAYQLKRWSTSG